MARETFIDPEGKPFEIETELLASDGNARWRMNERRWWGKAPTVRSFARHHAPTKSSRYGTIESRPTYGQKVEFEAENWHRCAHGQAQTLCRTCLAWLCTCPGSPKHSCRRAA